MRRNRATRGRTLGNKERMSEFCRSKPGGNSPYAAHGEAPEELVVYVFAEGHDQSILVDAEERHRRLRV